METGNNDPFYLGIANELRQKLLSGKFRPGQRFYSIRGLIKDTKRSLPTVRSALALLIKEGLLEARQGSGYYVTERVQAHANPAKGFSNFLAVIPSSTVPSEPWFTGRVGAGMIQAANREGAVVSFYQRRAPRDRSADGAKIDLERITAMKPDGIVWLHSSPSDIGILRELRSREIPIVTTMRRLPGLDLPLLREDDIVYASMVLSNFEARGHRRIAVILRPLTDDYFRSKMEAFREIGTTSSVRMAEEDFFYMPDDDVYGETEDDAIRAFIEERPGITGILVLASSAIRPLVRLFDTPLRERLTSLSLLLNVLDGVPVPSLPNGETVATIQPPLEKMGEQLINYLSKDNSRKLANAAGAAAGDARGAAEVRKGIAAATRLVPIFQAGDSLKTVAAV